jgi:hypothetical protein
MEESMWGLFLGIIPSLTYYLFICLQQRKALQLQEAYTVYKKHECSTNTEKQKKKLWAVQLHIVTVILWLV